MYMLLFIYSQQYTPDLTLLSKNQKAEFENLAVFSYRLTNKKIRVFGIIKIIFILIILPFNGEREKHALILELNKQT